MKPNQRGTICITFVLTLNRCAVEENFSSDDEKSSRRKSREKNLRFVSFPSMFEWEKIISFSSEAAKTFLERKQTRKFPSPRIDEENWAPTFTRNEKNSFKKIFNFMFRDFVAKIFPPSSFEFRDEKSIEEQRVSSLDTRLQMEHDLFLPEVSQTWSNIDELSTLVTRFKGISFERRVPYKDEH